MRKLSTALASAAAVIALVVAGWWLGPWRQKYSVPVPPPSASARQVVLAYLRALNAHDSATAYALSAPRFRDTTAYWLNSTARVTPIRIGSLQYFPKAPAGQRYDVPAVFWYGSHWWKQDPSFPDGRHSWGYQLVRVHGRFLIDDNGQA